MSVTRRRAFQFGTGAISEVRTPGEISAVRVPVWNYHLRNLTPKSHPGNLTGDLNPDYYIVTVTYRDGVQICGKVVLVRINM